MSTSVFYLHNPVSLPVMDIQSLSIVVPAGCPNNCHFCVSRMHAETRYENFIERDRAQRDLHRREFRRRLAFARDNGCNTLVFTGEGEPMQNRNFLEDVADWNNSLERPFRWLELQTSGVDLDEVKLAWLHRTVEVSTLSLSLSCIMDSVENARINRTPTGREVNIDTFCRQVTEAGLNLRLSLNMTDVYNGCDPGELFHRAHALGARQITFRILYKDNHPLTNEARLINSWIDAHSCNEETLTRIREFVTSQGRALERLPSGALRYAVEGLSTVVDDDCMSSASRETLRYLILRPDCRLYTKWDEPASLLF